MHNKYETLKKKKILITESLGITHCVDTAKTVKLSEHTPVYKLRDLVQDTFYLKAVLV